MMGCSLSLFPLQQTVMAQGWGLLSVQPGSPFVPSYELT